MHVSLIFNVFQAIYFNFLYAHSCAIFVGSRSLMSIPKKDIKHCNSSRVRHLSLKNDLTCDMKLFLSYFYRAVILTAPVGPTRTSHTVFLGGENIYLLKMGDKSFDMMNRHDINEALK